MYNTCSVSSIYLQGLKCSSVSLLVFYLYWCNDFLCRSLNRIWHPSHKEKVEFFKRVTYGIDMMNKRLMELCFYSFHQWGISCLVQCFVSLCTPNFFTSRSSLICIWVELKLFQRLRLTGSVTDFPFSQCHLLQSNLQHLQTI